MSKKFENETILDKYVEVEILRIYLQSVLCNLYIPNNSRF